MMRQWLLFAGAIAAASAAYVPGRAFDRFITIWLENQVCDAFFCAQTKLMTLVGLHESCA